MEHIFQLIIEILDLIIFNIKKFQIIGSAHNQNEINIKKKQRVKEIFISPIFKYKSKAPLGIHKSF